MISNKLPENWFTCALNDLVSINPKLDKSLIADELEVSFVPMPAVEAETGRIDVSAKKSFREVKKGYTPFREDDVLFAKITPCMENGKMAVVPKLFNDQGFGSTEFHVIRPADSISSKFIYYYISSKWFRYEAEHNMTGAVGQRRVPRLFLEQAIFPLPPLNEQKRIVAKVEELFSELDNGIAALKTAREQLKVYRQAVLKHAFEGKLTEQWRKDNADKLEAPEQLLARIQQERETRYQQQLEEWKAAVKAWETNGKEGKKPGKPKLPANLYQLSDSELTDIPDLPKGYIYTYLSNVGDLGRGKSKHRPRNDPKLFGGEYPFIQTAEVKAANRVIKEFSQTYSDFGLVQSKLWPAGTLCITIAANIAETAFLGFDGCFPDSVVGFTSYGAVLPEYVELFIKAVRVRIEAYAPATAQKNINLTTLENLVIPYCSIHEQQRVIEELESAFSVIDKNEEEIEQALIRAETLRQSILKKAFSGQLVPQDPNDEPASELLARIQAEKAASGVKAKKTPAKRGRKAKEVSE